MTYADLKAKIRQIIWPMPNEPKSLRVAHDHFFLHGMAEIQQWDLCLRQNHTNVIAASETLVSCAKTVLDMPAFPACNIIDVYTVNDSWCDPVYYDPCTFEQLRTWIYNENMDWTLPAAAGEFPGTDMQIVAPDTNVNAENRARRGFYALKEGKIWMAPSIQSYETIVVAWDGWKEDYEETDTIDTDLWGVHEQSCLAAFVKWHSKLNYPEQSGIATPVELLEREYNSILADLMHFCQQANAQRPPYKFVRRYATTEELDAGMAAPDMLPISGEVSVTPATPTVRNRDGHIEYWFPAEGLWKYMIPDTQDGVSTFYWSPGVAE